MKSIPELLVGVTIMAGAILIFYKETSGLVKLTSVVVLVLTIISSIAVFLIDQKQKN